MLLIPRSVDWLCVVGWPVS